jgi:AcrR family transcriptional regulator
MAATPAPNPRPIGRPRRFDPEYERSEILRAALEVMRRAGFAEANLTEILAECGLSTRSFYRHFASKDDLLLQLYRRDAVRAAERLSARVDRSSSGAEGLREWIDEVLSFGYDPRKRERVAVMGSQAARRAVGYSDAQEESVDLTILPLVAALRRGNEDGTLSSADPEEDARIVYSMAFGIVNRRMAGSSRFTRPDALRHLMRFVGPALALGDDVEPAAVARARPTPA